MDAKTPKQKKENEMEMSEEQRIEVKKYNDFMNKPENIGNCTHCPENINADSWQGRLPCGQYNCWVKIHCRE